MRPPTRPTRRPHLGTGSTHPRVGDASVTTVLAPDGVATLVWVATGASEPRLMAQVQRPGEPWGSPVQIRPAGG